MALWKKKSLEHRWLPQDSVLETDLVRLVEITPELDAGYLAVLDDDFMEVHHWPESTLKHLKRGLGADRRTRHGLTKDTALLVAPHEPMTVMGFVSIEQLGVANEPWQVGLQLRPKYRGVGIVTSLLPMLVDRLSQVDEYTDVSLSTSTDNVAMSRVCKKLGYHHNTVQYRHPDGTVETARSYILLPR